MPEGDLAGAADGVRLAGRDHVVVRLVLLQHQPHRAHVVAGEAPVALRVEVAEAKLGGRAELDARHAVGDLARHELQAAPRRLVVEEDARDGEHVVALAVVHRDEVAVGLGDAVRAARVERRLLALRHLAAPCRTSPTTTPGRSGSTDRRCGSPRACASRRRAVNSAVSTGCDQDVGTKLWAARL